MEEQSYKSIVHSAPFGYAYHKIINDDSGNAIDYLFLETNAVFNEILEAKDKAVVGKKLSEVVQNREINVAETVDYFAEVANTGKPKEAEYQIPALNKWIKLHAFSPARGYFVVTFIDVTSIKQSKETIEQKNQMNAILQAMPDALFVIDKGGKILDVYTSRPDMLIKPVRVIIGSNLNDCFPPDEAKELIKLHRECILNNEIVVHEYNMTINGEQRHFEARLSPVDDTKLISLVRDFTSEKKLRMAHKEEVTFSRFLFENALDGLILFNDEYQIIDANTTFTKMIGYKIGELNQLHAWDIDAISTKDQIREKFNAPHEVNETFETVHVRKDGSTYHVEISAKSMSWKGDRHILCSCRDITTKILTSKLIKESEEKYRSITRQLTEMLFLHDEEGQLLEVNKTAATESGYSEEELKRMNVFDIHIPKENLVGKETLIDLWKNFAVGERHTFEVRHRRKDGSIIPVEIKTGKISIGNKHYILALGQNITERKKTENKLIESDRLKSAFINNISHEIRTPLNTILGFGQLMADDELTREQRQKHVKLVQQSSNRLMQTITDIMDISMVSAGSIENNPKEITLMSFLENWVNKTKQLCQTKNIVVKLDTPNTHNDAKIYCDNELLDKVFGHLISNAVKFTNEGRITLGYSIIDNGIAFFIKDTGKGIDTEKQKLIFEAFNQADPSVTRGHEGIGLGLSIANAVTGFMNGKMWLESEVGKGSAFHFSLPCEVKSTQIQEIKPPEIKQESLANALVLIAEDDELNYYYLSAVLDAENVSSLHAKNGAEAVDLCKRYPEITMVLMDIKMPVMNGLEATKEIKKLSPDLPVIAITAHAQTGDEQRILDAGCNAYAPKPVSKDTLLKLIHDFHNLGG
mgnify:CR=1 FL=1